MPLLKTLEFYKAKYKIKCTRGDLEHTACKLIKYMIKEWGEKK